MQKLSKFQLIVLKLQLTLYSIANWWNVPGQFWAMISYFGMIFIIKLGLCLVGVGKPITFYLMKDKSSLICCFWISTNFQPFTQADAKCLWLSYFPHFAGIINSFISATDSAFPEIYAWDTKQWFFWKNSSLYLSFPRSWQITFGNNLRLRLLII